MANIKDWLLSFEKNINETIESIVVGPHYNDRWNEPDRRPEHQRDVPISRDEGLALVNIEFDNGYGGADCFPVYAWTPNFIFAISEYDGATGYHTIPRNPVASEPEFM